jgi:glycine cleavage system aminomethyltransferase T
MTVVSLQDKLHQAGSPVRMLRESQMGPYVYPIPAEFSNWRDEQLAWHQGVALLDQSFHMTDLCIDGPDALRLLSHLGINSFANFGRNKAKQLVACNPDGFVIGDAILFGLEEDRYLIIGRPVVANWVQFNAETGDFNVRLERDERSLSNPKPRKTYRFEIQGPKAPALLEKLNGGPLKPIKFFNMGEIRIAGREVRALRHGMGGAPGLEIWGPLDEGADIKAAILEAGREFGLRQVGGRAYGSVAVESGWIPSPLPAIYSGESMRAYRDWLKADSFESLASVGGSFYSERVDDYYLTPWDLDYGRLIRFDHDFVGRVALERMTSGPHRRKVTLVWNPDDVLAIQGSMYGNELPGKFMEMPTSHYAAFPYDKVLSQDRSVGISTYAAYTANERAWISLAIVNEEVAKLGTELTVVWGEEAGGSKRPVVERHNQMPIRATVNPWPYSKLARSDYRPEPK